MKGDPRVLNVSSQVLRKEQTGINQYFVHAKMCKNWGYDVLCQLIRSESMGKMKHADQLIERILFLEGAPNLSAYDKITVGPTVKEQLENDLAWSRQHWQCFTRGLKPAWRQETMAAVNSWSTSLWTKSTTLTGSKPSSTKKRKWAIRTT